MNKSSLRAFLLISACLFGVVAALHLWRALNAWAVMIGPYSVPVTLSWIGAVVATCLSVWALRLRTRE